MQEKSKIKMSSNRGFGLVFFFVLIIIGLWPLKNNGDIRIYFVLTSMLFLGLGLINSKILTPLNSLWFKLGILIGAIVSPIVMGIVFFLVVTPTGFIMKLLGNKMLDHTFDKNKNSYWITRNKQNSSMKKQF
jgi:predicted membrane metal-binding protein